MDWANRRVLAFYRPFWVEGSDSGWSSAKLSAGTLGAAGITWSSVEHPYAAAVNTWKIAVDQSYSQPGQTRFGLVYRNAQSNPKGEFNHGHYTHEGTSGPTLDFGSPALIPGPHLDNPGKTQEPTAEHQ